VKVIAFVCKRRNFIVGPDVREFLLATPYNGVSLSCHVGCGVNGKVAMHYFRMGDETMADSIKERAPFDDEGLESWHPLQGQRVVFEDEMAKTMGWRSAENDGMTFDQTRKIISDAAQSKDYRRSGIIDWSDE
jgi:hypothetical protein